MDHENPILHAVSPAADILTGSEQPSAVLGRDLPRPTYAVVPADLVCDREAILSVWKANFPRDKLQEERFDWNYGALSPNPGRCFLLVAGPGQRIVGTACLMVRRVRLGRDTVLAGVASDFAVDREHRTLQPALMLQKAVLGCMSEGLALIYGLPNPKSVTVFQRLGYHIRGPLRRYVKLLRVERHMRAGAGEVSFSRRVLISAANAALRCSTLSHWSRPRGRGLVQLSLFDSRFDELWARASKSYPAIGERTASFLRWRFGQCPLHVYVTLGLMTEQEECLRGYAVVRGEDGGQICVVDFLVENREDFRDDMIAGLLDWARGRGNSSVSFEFFGSERMDACLRRFGFEQRPSQSMPLVYWPGPRFLLPPQSVLRDWYFTHGDEDYD